MKKTNAPRITEPDLRDESNLGMEDKIVRRAEYGYVRTEAHSQVERIAKKLGRRVIWDCKFGDGYIDNAGNIHLAPTTVDPVTQVFKHELTHFLQKHRIAYTQFADRVIASKVFKNWLHSKGYASVKDMNLDIQKKYAEAEKRRQAESPDAPAIKTGEDAANYEIIAKFVSEMLFGGKYELLESIAGELNEKQRRSFWQAIKDFIAHLKEKLFGTGRDSADDELSKEKAELERIFVRTYELAQRALEKEQGNKKTAEDGSVEYSYAGVNSRTADKSLLLKAQSMLDNGADSETVRKETGWFKGYDGKWRFEIDDSQAQFRPEGDVQLMKDESYRRLQELTDKWADDSLTEAETEEMDWLSEQFSDRVWEKKYRLDDYLDHPDLYDAYPMLRYTSLVFDDLPPGEKGFFNPRSNTIVLSRDLFGKQKNTLLHEIQHIIQKYEGFSKGSSPKYWNDRMESGYSKRDENGIELMPSELYKATAGEIEARDTASRADMTSEQRKNTRPDIDRTDVVFADGGVSYSVQKTFDEQVDDVINGTHNPRLDLYVTDTPKYLINLNFSDSPILMRNSKVSEILNKHSDMSVEIIKKIPKAIENPLLVLKSKTHPKDSVVIITDISTAKGDMIVPVWANQTGNYIDLDLGDVSLNTNFVASAYGRNTANLIEYAVNNNGVLYQNSDVKKVSQLLARNGLQLSTPLKLSDSDITVSQKAQSVNSQYMQEGENYTEPRQYSIPDRMTADDLFEQVERGDITAAEARGIWNARKIYDPVQIARMDQNDADTTPKRAPKRDYAQGDSDSRFYGNVMSSSLVDDMLKERVKSNEFIKHYRAITNKGVLEDALKRLETGGREEVEKWFAMKPSRMSPEDIALGAIIMERYQMIGDTEGAVNTLMHLREAGTLTAQTLQMFSIFQRLGPDAMVAYVQRELDEAFEALSKGRTQKWLEENESRFELTEEEIEYIRRHTLAAQDPQADKRSRDVETALIYKTLAEKIPPAKGQSVKSLARINMLLNIKTQSRNVLGNLGMVPVHIHSE